jgi:hypothetical protein
MTLCLGFRLSGDSYKYWGKPHPSPSSCAGWFPLKPIRAAIRHQNEEEIKAVCVRIVDAQKVPSFFLYCLSLWWWADVTCVCIRDDSFKKCDLVSRQITAYPCVLRYLGLGRILTYFPGCSTQLSLLLRYLEVQFSILVTSSSEEYYFVRYNAV